jgi:hypothetical protein
VSEPVAMPQYVTYDSDLTWHVESNDDPNIALCGFAAGPGDPHLPGEEVPDELCCPRCLTLERKA